MLSWFSRPVVRIVLVALVVGGLGVLAIAPAFAHTALIASTPADGQTMERPPSELTLTFSDAPIEQFTEITVTAQGQSRLQLSRSRLDDATVRQPLPAEMPAGRYDVAWKVVAADGHPISGTLSFTVTAGSSASSGSASPSPAASSSQATPAASSPGNATPSPTGKAGTTAGSDAHSATEDLSNWAVWLGLGAGLVILAGLIGAIVRRAKGDV